ncbi:tRNA lysidine(34) synthetase TilS [Deinococcus soli (ex Cha et al. 2016)]|uniref:Multifunctional fusion protein n=1 Tax=Deinococcus soli (ex Cha et al. 2016) TaxID=1309411 RepID=A0A0F7JQT2_9DEIO|nr:tRNA lysidine(34) synthetase TilS [Deinococcus soli (ex Cha et al. 2016)]AKH17709.1 tRNA(Ile)-lysidine synthase [Deinococcus soli (ex Cha et al. 2016)]
MPDPTESLLRPLREYAEAVVVVGVSGGADSVALLLALRQAGARPVAAHLDHALRPDSAQDAAWVQALAARLEVPYAGARVDVGAVAARRGWNTEDAARRLRYDFLARAAKAHGAPVILTAHTRRDQAETVLTALLRGEAILHGIPAVRGRVRRPWLDVPRADLEVFLRVQGQDWREDPTNDDPAYTRAWLRRDVMPVLTARYPALETTLARVARHQAQDDDALSAQAERITPHAPLRAVPPAVLRRWLRARLRDAGLDAHATHLDTLADALTSGGTTHLDLPGAHPVTVTGGRVHLTPQTYPAPDFPLPDGWTRRTRQPGDRIHLPGGTRKLSDVLTDRHVPRADRDRVPLLVSDAGVQWIGLQPPIWASGAREHAAQPPEPLHAAMGEALAQARLAADAQEVPVGAVVLGPDGTVVGRGRNTSREHGDMTRHAELTALREATRTLGTPYLTGCTLVVTLEPCPMCLGAALEARIGHIVYGAANPKAGALGGVTDLLAAHWGHAPRVTPGIRAREAVRLLKQVFSQLRASRP